MVDFNSPAALLRTSSAVLPASSASFTIFASIIHVGLKQQVSDVYLSHHRTWAFFTKSLTNYTGNDSGIPY